MLKLEKRAYSDKIDVYLYIKRIYLENYSGDIINGEY